MDKNEKSHLSANDSDKTSYDNDLRLDANSEMYSHLSAENQHLSEPQNTVETRNNDAELCPTCSRELDEMPSGQAFCEICLYTKPL